MFGTVCHPKLSTFIHLDLLKEQLNSPIFHQFLNIFNLKSYLRVYRPFVCLWVGVYCLCVHVCMHVWQL